MSLQCTVKAKAKEVAEEVGWLFGRLVVLGLTAFETVFQSVSGCLPKSGRKRREKDR